MAELATVDLDEVVDGQKVTASSVALLAIGLLTLLSDGFDLAAIGYVAPELVKQWQVAPAALAPAFSAGIAGLLVGAPLFGFVGDRFGRRTAILIGLCLFGGLSLATAAAASLTQLTVLRFLTGIGLGGVIPNVTALVAETAPKRLRGRFVVIASFGVPLGISLPGLAAAALVPRFGWEVLMLLGGVLPLAVAALAWLKLPESIKFLAERGRAEEARRAARAMRPDLSIGNATRIVAAAQGSAVQAGSPRALFAGGLAAITPLLWYALAANQMSNFFSLTWLPTLLQSAGSSTAQAGVSGSLFSLGGLAGGACLAVVIDRLGVVPLVVLFFAGAPLIAAIGLPDLSPAAHAAAIACAGFCVTGINFGMNATLSTIYPTPVRAAGTGWGQAAGRVGALAAPVIGGVLLGLNLPVRELLLAPALVLGTGAIACTALAVLCIRRFGGVRIGERPAAEAAPPRDARTAYAGDGSGPAGRP